MLRFSLLLTILAVLGAVLVDAGPVRRPRPSRPSRPSRPPVISRPKPPVIVHRPTTRPGQTRPKPPVIVHRPTTPGGTHPGGPQGSPLPGHPASTTRPGSPPMSTPSTPPSSPGGSNRPTTPPPTQIEQLAGCRAYTTCDTCAAHSTRRNINVPNASGRGSRRVAVSCAWLQTTQQDTGRCVTISPGVSHPATSLSTSAQQCTALHTAVHNRHVRAATTRAWNAMSSHTFNGDPTGRPENGRHLASSWVAQFPDDPLTTNAQTHLAKSVAKGKTLWMDDAAPAPYTGGWSRAEIQAMCLVAIEASIREHAGSGRQTPDSQRSDMDLRPMSGHHAYSVRTERGNLCIDVFDSYSCFPAALTTTSKPQGQKCALAGQMLP